MSTLREGDRINNYLLEARVGAGSFGEVWRARHHVFKDVVAVKVPTDPQYVRNLQREGVVVHGLKHPNIVRAIDLDPYADPPYFIMEYVDGPSLRHAIDQYGREFPINAAVEVLRGVLHALSAAHDGGLIHRDVKPANILLNHPLDELATVKATAVKMTDFGLGHVGGVTTQSLMQSGSLLTSEGHSVAGTVVYMSPEQKEGKELDQRSDLYSCGVVLCEMLTGERPQGGDAPGSVRPGVPPALDRIFQRCYTRHDRRFGSAREVLDALESFQDQGGTSIAIPLSGSVMPGADRRCPACSAAVERDDQFCIRCGRQLVASVPRCPSCEAFVHTSDRFCILCGKDLRVLSS